MTNVGGIDRVLRIIVGIVLLLAPFATSAIPALAGLGGWIWVVFAVGAVLLLTGLFRMCPAYTLLGISTCPRQ